MPTRAKSKGPLVVLTLTVAGAIGASCALDPQPMPPAESRFDAGPGPTFTPPDAAPPRFDAGPLTPPHDATGGFADTTTSPGALDCGSDAGPEACEGADGGASDAQTDGGDGEAGPPDARFPCLGLSECDCYKDPACNALTEACYCPSVCGGPPCACGGGASYGCHADGCPPTTCNWSTPVSGPDLKGCLFCEPAKTCADAKSHFVGVALAAHSCNVPESRLTGLLCDINPSCVLGCMAKVKSCEEIGCGLCEACGCSKLGSFDKCVLDCRATP